MPIEKREIAPKTYELYNTDRGIPPPTPITQAAQEAYDEIRSGDVAKQMFEEEQRLVKHRVLPSEPAGWNKATSVDDFLQAAQGADRDTKNFWRKQASNLDKTLKKDPGNFDLAVEGIQEMLDTGAIYMDDNGGVYTAFPKRGGEKRNDRLLNAAGTWGDWYRDQLAYGEDVGPNGRASQEMDNTVAQRRIAPEAEQIEMGRIKAR